MNGDKHDNSAPTINQDGELGRQEYKKRKKKKWEKYFRIRQKIHISLNILCIEHDKAELPKISRDSGLFKKW